jgi:mannose-1-phosphate guanylyltransferase
MKTIPLILAGGKGERFWPLSRSSRPKQLLRLFGNATMIGETISRVRTASGGQKPLVITGRDCAAGIRKALAGRGAYDCIVEPAGKNTAPAIALAAVWMHRRYGETVMLVASSDHVIAPLGAYVKAVRVAVAQATRSPCLVVFGIRPTRPDVGYGYIKVGEPLPKRNGIDCFTVNRFEEKPSPVLARKYVAAKTYLWNSGMFVWRTSVILAEFERSMPELYRQACRAEREGFTKRAIERFYANCGAQSIDYGIMEKSPRIVTIAGTFFWDDIGSWEALSRVHRPNGRGTVAQGKRLFESGCVNSIIHNSSDLTVACIGLDDTVLVVTSDAVLAIARPLLPEIKKYLGMMKDRKFPRSLF